MTIIGKQSWAGDFGAKWLNVPKRLEGKKVKFSELEKMFPGIIPLSISPNRDVVEDIKLRNLSRDELKKVQKIKSLNDVSIHYGFDKTGSPTGYEFIAYECGKCEEIILGPPLNHNFPLKGYKSSNVETRIYNCTNCGRYINTEFVN